jgi:hypothetical protein
MNEDFIIEEIIDEKEICKDAIMAVSEALINMSEKMNIITSDIKNLNDMYAKLKVKINKLEQNSNNNNKNNNNITTIFENTEEDKQYNNLPNINKKENVKENTKVNNQKDNRLIEDVKVKLVKMRRKR